MTSADFIAIIRETAICPKCRQPAGVIETTAADTKDANIFGLSCESPDCPQRQHCAIALLQETHRNHPAKFREWARALLIAAGWSAEPETEETRLMRVAGGLGRYFDAAEVATRERVRRGPDFPVLVEKGGDAA